MIKPLLICDICNKQKKVTLAVDTIKTTSMLLGDVSVDVCAKHEKRFRWIRALNGGTRSADRRKQPKKVISKVEAKKRVESVAALLRKRGPMTIPEIMKSLPKGVIRKGLKSAPRQQIMNVLNANKKVFKRANGKYALKEAA